MKHPWRVYKDKRNPTIKQAEKEVSAFRAEGVQERRGANESRVKNSKNKRRP